MFNFSREKMFFFFCNTNHYNDSNVILLKPTEKGLIEIIIGVNETRTSSLVSKIWQSEGAFRRESKHTINNISMEINIR